MGVGASVGVGVGVSVGVAGPGVSVLVDVAGSVTVALTTGLRLWLLLMATESAVISISTLVVASSLIWKWTIISILSEGTFKLTTLPSWNVAVASFTCNRMFV